MKQIAVFDIDKCLYSGTLAVDFIKQMIAVGAISSDAPETNAYQASKSDTDLVAALKAAQIAGINREDYLRAGSKIAQGAVSDLNKRVGDLLQQSKDQGRALIAISHSPYAVVKPFCDLAGPFDIVIAPMYQAVGDKIGTSSIIRATERSKGEWLVKLVDLYGFTFTDSTAIGDSSSDISMLDLVDRPIAYNPDPDLEEHAKQRGWEIW